MHIKERGLQIRISLYLIFTISMIWCSEPVKAMPEVVMGPSYKEEQIKEQNTLRDLQIVGEVVEQKELLQPRYGFTDKEIYLLTVLLCGSGKTDGDGEYDFDFETPRNQQQVSLVLNVVMNRVNSKKFPNTVSGVVWARNQFVYMPHWKKGLPRVKAESYAVVEAWCNAYDAYDNTIITIPKSHLYFSGNGMVNKSSERW